MSSERIEQFYRDATDKDVLRVMKGEKVEARFSDEMTAFFNSTLGGWAKHRVYVWVDGDGAHWQFCQVYDPPQYWLDKPDPGEGYRLLGKFPDEDLQPGDEVRMPNEEKWRLSDLATVGGTQHEGAWYRRRIEQPKPGPKHYTLQVGDTIETPSLLRIIVTPYGIEVQ